MLPYQTHEFRPTLLALVKEHENLACLFFLSLVANKSQTKGKPGARFMKSQTLCRTFSTISTLLRYLCSVQIPKHEESV